MAATSSASSGVPSWNVTPWRILKRHTRPSSVGVPALGQPRLRLELAVRPDEVLARLAEHAQAALVGDGHRVERARRLEGARADRAALLRRAGLRRVLALDVLLRDAARGGDEPEHRDRHADDRAAPDELAPADLAGPAARRSGGSRAACAARGSRRADGSARPSDAPLPRVRALHSAPGPSLRGTVPRPVAEWQRQLRERQRWTPGARPATQSAHGSRSRPSASRWRRSTACSATSRRTPTRRCATLARARSEGADLVVFPELTLTGYSMGHVGERRDARVRRRGARGDRRRGRRHGLRGRLRGGRARAHLQQRRVPAGRRACATCTASSTCRRTTSGRSASTSRRATGSAPSTRRGAAPP